MLDPKKILVRKNFGLKEIVGSGKIEGKKNCWDIKNLYPSLKKILGPKTIFRNNLGLLVSKFLIVNTAYVPQLDF